MRRVFYEVGYSSNNIMKMLTMCFDPVWRPRTKDTVVVLRDQNINFVRKEYNTPNAQQLRPKEKYWALTHCN